VDTVKQAETFAAVRAEWSIPRVESLKLRDFPTLRHVVGFVRQHRPDLAPVAAPAPASSTSTPAPGPASKANGHAATMSPVAEPIPLERADEAPRRVAAPVLRPPLELCKPTGVRIGPGVRVVIAAGAGGGLAAVDQKVADLGATPLVLDAHEPAAALEATLRGWLAE